MNLHAVSPLDGRYHRLTTPLSGYFSEYGLMKYRVQVEIEYFIALVKKEISGLQNVSTQDAESLREVYQNFSDEDYEEIKAIEKTTNHDVKAVEYFIKKKFDAHHLAQYKEFIHFGLTSQDINNTAMPMMLRDAIRECYIPLIKKIEEKLAGDISQWKQMPMLARTHGQPASPTTLGKEFEVFLVRIQTQTSSLATLTFSAKFGGATGNFNAHHVAYPGTDWREFSRSFLSSLGLEHQWPTTQIEHYDGMASCFHLLMRIHTILIDMCRDIWTYISMDYFTQQIREGEVGSSAMPHKVNPIDFENAEGNLGLANAVLSFMADKLPISRLQRDLTDSTITRNIGVPIGHGVIALNSIIKGLHKLEPNNKKMQTDLEQQWAVVAEAIQTILRREGYPEPYEVLKKHTRTTGRIDKNSIRSLIESIDVPSKIKDEMLRITPTNYVGYANEE